MLLPSDIGHLALPKINLLEHHESLSDKVPQIFLLWNRHQLVSCPIYSTKPLYPIISGFFFFIFLFL